MKTNKLNKKHIFNIFLALCFVFVSVPYALASPTALPPADPPPLPQWGGLTFPAAGESYTDAVSGMNVWRATDESAPATGAVWAHAGAQATHISRTADGSRYFVLLKNTQTETPWMAEFRRGSGFSNYRNMSDMFSSVDQAQFSRVYGYGLYYVSPEGVLTRYDANKQLAGDWRQWPKNLKADARVLSAFGNTFVARDLQLDNEDEWFSVRVVDGGANRGVAVWNSLDNRVCTYRGNVTRHFHFESGDFVLVEEGGSSYTLLNLSDCSSSGASIGFVPDAIDAGLGYAVMRNPNTREIFRYDPNSRSMSSFAGPAEFSNGGASVSAGWSTQAAGPGQWLVGSGWGLDADHVVVGGFEYLVSEIYVTNQVSFNWAEDKVGAALEGIFGGGFWMEARNSVSELFPGTYYWDDVAKVLYVFRAAGGNPENIVQGYDPRAGFQGIIFYRADWSDARFLAHHHSLQDGSGLESRPAVAPDGSLVMWTTDMYNSGRTDVFIAETPVSSAPAEPFPLPQVDIKANDSDGPITVQCGDALRLSWDTGNNPNQCTASGNWSGVKMCEAGLETVGAITPPGTHFYTMTAANEYGSTDDTVEVEVLADPPVVDLKVDGSDQSVTIPYGGSVQLSWTAEGTDPLQCFASGDWSGTKNCGSGAETIGPFNQARTYIFTLAASDVCGNSNDTVTVTVLPPPSIDIKANGLDSGITILNNSTVNISWTTNGSPTFCSASGDWSGTKSCSGGSEVLGPYSGPRTLAFSISASNGYVATNDSVSVSVLGGKQGDINGDGCVNVVDLGIVLSYWGATGSTQGDVSRDGLVNVIDLGIVLSNWGC